MKVQCYHLWTFVKCYILVVIYLLVPIHAYSQATQSQEYRIVPADIDAININIQEDYGDLKVEEQSKRANYISDVIQIMLNRNGIKTTQLGKNESGNYLYINISGEPIAAIYSNAGKRYTGAKIEGKLILSLFGRTESETFNGKSEPSFNVIGDSYKKPEEAPFYLALNDSGLFLHIAQTMAAIIDIPPEQFLFPWFMSKIYNYDALDALVGIGKPSKDLFVGILNDKKLKREYRLLAALALRRLEIKSFDVFQSLITAIEEPILQHDFVFNTLEQLTGKKFGKEVSEWKEWWRQAQNTYIQKNTSQTKSEKPKDENSLYLFPEFRKQLKGANEVRINNPNNFKVTVALRSGDSGRDFEAPANGVASVFVPNGTYEIYFVYSNKSDELYEGDKFTLDNKGIEIKLIKVVGGNYGIRKVGK